MKLSRTDDPVAKYQFTPKFVKSASKLYSKNNEITKNWWFSAQKSVWPKVTAVCIKGMT